MQKYRHIKDSSTSVVRLLDKSRSVRTYRGGDKLFVQNTPAAGLYCVQSGHLLLWQEDNFGFKTSFRMVGQGELIGYRSLLGADRHAATAEALSECRICFYPKQDIEPLIYENPGLVRHFFRLLARDRGPPDGLLLRGQHLPVRVRLIYLLLTTRERHSKSVEEGELVYDLPLSRKNISTLIGARPETVARAIKDLSRDGIAIFKNRKVVVPDLARLYEETRSNPGHPVERESP